MMVKSLEFVMLIIGDMKKYSKPCQWSAFFHTTFTFFLSTLGIIIIFLRYPSNATQNLGMTNYLERRDFCHPEESPVGPDPMEGFS